MKNRYFRVALISITVLLTGCGLWDSGSDRIAGKYFMLWIDLPQNQGICEKIENGSLQIVPEYVFATGHNDDYIIAKQHPTSGFDNGYKIDPKITNYYIIDMHRKVLRKETNVFGPLTLSQFDSIRAILKIKEIEFDKKYPDEP